MYMCVFYRVARRGASGGLKEGEGAAKRVRVSVCESLYLVRVPGRPRLWERGRRPGGVSGIGLRDEWARDEWREAAEPSLLGVRALVWDGLTEAG